MMRDAQKREGGAVDTMVGLASPFPAFAIKNKRLYINYLSNLINLIKEVESPSASWGFRCSGFEIQKKLT
jgi:hypothetical protein